MPNSDEKITIFVPEQSIKETTGEDRAGGETHGAITGYIQKKAVEIDVDVEIIKNNIENTITKINGILMDVSQTVSDNWEMEGITIGLSLSAEGSVGFATAGIETSIEVSFTPKKISSQ